MNRNRKPDSADRPWNRVEAPTVTRDDLHGDKHEHPAFAAISASRVSGQANLFGSSVGHSGFVKIEISEARMYRDGYSDSIHGGGKEYIEVWLSEAQWVAFVSRMNVGSGTPCTLRHYGTRDGVVFCPQIADPELPAERMAARVGQLEAENLRRVDEQHAALRAACEGLPKKKADAILRAAGLMSQHLKANHEFAGKTLREFKETLVTESKVEIDAMVTDVVQRLGLSSIEQLAQIAADPTGSVRQMAKPEGEEHG